MSEARPGNQRLTVGADKAYDTAEFVDTLRCANATPHVAQNTSNRRSAIDGRTTRHPGYTVSQRIRKTHRGVLWLGQGHRPAAQDPRARRQEGRLRVHPDLRRLQPGHPSSTFVGHFRADF